MDDEKVPVHPVQVSDDQIKRMVDRFLQWRLPENFTPDAGISFKKMFNEHTAHPMQHEPTGTNLFDATQAEEMIRYITEQPAPIPRVNYEPLREPIGSVTEIHEEAPCCKKCGAVMRCTSCGQAATGPETAAKGIILNSELAGYFKSHAVIPRGKVLELCELVAEQRIRQLEAERDAELKPLLGRLQATTIKAAMLQLDDHFDGDAHMIMTQRDFRQQIDKLAAELAAPRQAQATFPRGAKVQVRPGWESAGRTGICLTASFPSDGLDWVVVQFDDDSSEEGMEIFKIRGLMAV